MGMDFKTFNHCLQQKIITELALSEKFSMELRRHTSSLEIINVFITQQLHESALHYIALGLPKRQAAWWGFLIAKEVNGSNADIMIQNALKTSEQWIRNPSEETRYQAKHIADALDLYIPASWVCMSIFWSGNNIAPIDKPPVEPGEFMSGNGIYNAIETALKTYPQELRHAQKNQFLRQGVHIAMGGNGLI